MAAAYAALVSLTHVIEQIMVHHARQPIFLHKQLRQIESLQKEVSFLQDFLEVYSHGFSHETAGLASRIADAAYAAEDIIESHVVNNILPQDDPVKLPKKNVMFDAMQSCFGFRGENSSNCFSLNLQRVKENIDYVREEAMEVKRKSRVDDEQPSDVVPVVSSRSTNTDKDTEVEYYEEDLEQIMDKLTGQSSDLQTIPIVGMGGIGKTTLARNVYDNPLILECFYIRAWVTISQEYNLREVLLALLQEIGVSDNKEKQENSEYHELGDMLHKHLFGRKYLIILDDMWSNDAWENLKLFLPDGKNGSRIMITTRFSKVADSSDSSHLYKMNYLDENKSWNLLCKKVFGRDGNCPPELEEIGKEIAKSCGGLPLSIVVIGGLLSKYEMTPKYWEYIAKDINQIVNSGHWSKILTLSYNHLPIHLKPCFLYLGIYPEDCEIRVSELIKLWVAEGLLKPSKDKSLEEVARDYLKDLVERNLILVRKWGSVGKMKTCSIHDLIRDFCLKKAQKEMFLFVFKPNNHAQSVNMTRRIVFHEDWYPVIDFRRYPLAWQSLPVIRSLTCDFYLWERSRKFRYDLRLLRVLTKASKDSLESFLQLVNLRYLKCDVFHGDSATFVSLKCQLWYLQTLIFTGFTTETAAPDEIWEMPQLRHIISEHPIFLPDLSRGLTDGQDDFVLKNLQTLSFIRNFKCTDEALKRIPNIKKLSIQLDSKTETGTSNDCLHNLGRLHKLRSLTLIHEYTAPFQNASFPQSLNKLALSHCNIDWDGFTETVGSLPHLEKLKLKYCDGGAEWNSVEGTFLRLKFLEIDNFDDLVCWTADSPHFPLLQRLVLKEIWRLKEIPSSFGDTLQSIELVDCSYHIVDSAEEIVEEQQSFGNEGLGLTVRWIYAWII